jgi:hypothetical protein
MPSSPRVIESLTPARSCLAGSILTGGPFVQPLSLTNFSQLQASRFLKLVHGSGLASSQIRSAMLQKTIFHKMAIATSDGEVTLVNAQIVNIEPYRPPVKPKHNHPTGGVSHEETLVSVTFQKIDIAWNKKSKVDVDNWNAGS